MKSFYVRLAVVSAVCLLVVPALTAQEPYKVPPKEVVDIVTAVFPHRGVPCNPRGWFA